MHKENSVSHMPHTQEAMVEVLETCRESWLNTREGQRYKARYEQLKTELEKLESDMDIHVARHFRELWDNEPQV